MRFLLVVAVVILVIIALSARVAKEWERGVILRLGRVSSVKGPGLFFISVMTAAIRSRASVPAVGSERMTGLVGEARSDIAPEGQVFAKGTLWKARTAGMAIPEGAKVTILGVSGLLLIVEQAEAVARPE